MLLVMMMTELRKSTRRPWLLVRRPSSRIWSRTLNTSGCAFSISSNRMTLYGRRRADEPRHRVLLHVLRHIDPHHRALVVEQELRERPRRLGLAHAGGAEEN